MVFLVLLVALVLLAVKAARTTGFGGVAAMFMAFDGKATVAAAS
jgi:hypothetical protein